MYYILLYKSIVFLDVLGVRIGLLCPAGKYVINSSTDNDYLTPDGRLIAKGQNSHAYCIETFDVSDCDDNQEVVVTALACFIKGVDKNYLMAATVRQKEYLHYIKIFSY